MLTREEAQQLLLNRLKDRQDGHDHFVDENRTLERPFGWLFFVAESTTAQAETLSHRMIIVNKHVEQVIESSIDYTPQQFIEIIRDAIGQEPSARAKLVSDYVIAVSLEAFRRRRSC
jgi:hypothetical protein